MRGTTAPWRPGGQRRGGRWTAAGHPGARPAWRAACDPGAFSGTVRLGRRLRPHAALADRHLAKPRHPAPGPHRGLLVAASTDHPPAAHRELPPAGTGGLAPEDAERAVAVVRAALAADGPLTRSQL